VLLTKENKMTNLRELYTLHIEDADDAIDPEYVLKEDHRWVIQDSTSWGTGYTIWELPGEHKMIDHGQFDNLKTAMVKVGELRS